MNDIFIVEDHPLMRRSLTALIHGEADLQVLGQAGSAEEALEALLQLSPDLILVDISLPGMSGLDLLDRLQNRSPQLACLVISGHNESQYGRAALESGARGYVSKYNVREIIPAIRSVLAGDTSFGDQVLSA